MYALTSDFIREKELLDMPYSSEHWPSEYYFPSKTSFPQTPVRPLSFHPKLLSPTSSPASPLYQFSPNTSCACPPPPTPPPQTPLSISPSPYFASPTPLGPHCNTIHSMLVSLLCFARHFIVMLIHMPAIEAAASPLCPQTGSYLIKRGVKSVKCVCVPAEVFDTYTYSDVGFEGDACPPCIVMQPPVATLQTWMDAQDRTHLVWEEQVAHPLSVSPGPLSQHPLGPFHSIPWALVTIYP